MFMKFHYGGKRYEHFCAVTLRSADTYMEGLDYEFRDIEMYPVALQVVNHETMEVLSPSYPEIAPIYDFTFGGSRNWNKPRGLSVMD